MAEKAQANIGFEKQLWSAACADSSADDPEATGAPRTE